MQVVICYDITDNKLRYRLVKYLEKIAVRVQLSVFKADIQRSDIAKLKRFAVRLLNDGSLGNLLIYKIQEELSGTEKTALPESFIIL